MKRLFNFTLLCALLVFAGNAFGQTTEEGVALYEQGDYAKAVEVLEKAAAADKNDRRAWVYLGMSYTFLKNRDKAFEAFKNAEKIKPEELNEGGIKPVKIITKPASKYTDEARQNNVQGTIKLAVEFGADGKIKNIAAFRTLPDGLTENTIKAAEGIVFEPATKDGKPISDIRILSYSFTIY